MDALHFWIGSLHSEFLGDTMHLDDAADSVARGKSVAHTDADGHMVVISVKINEAARDYLVANATRYWQAHEAAHALTDRREQFIARQALADVIAQIAHEAGELQ
jgi:hypothetical protein